MNFLIQIILIKKDQNSKIKVGTGVLEYKRIVNPIF